MQVPRLPHVQHVSSLLRAKEDALSNPRRPPMPILYKKTHTFLVGFSSSPSENNAPSSASEACALAAALAAPAFFNLRRFFFGSPPAPPFAGVLKPSSPLGASDLTFLFAALRALRCSRSSSLSFFTRSALHCCASCRASARAAASTSASNRSFASRSRYQKKKKGYSKGREERERDKAPRAPRRARVPQHAFVARLPFARSAPLRAAVAHLGVLRHGAAYCLRTSCALRRDPGRMVPRSPLTQVTRTSSVRARRARSRAATLRVCASRAGVRRGARRTFVGSSRCCTRWPCPRAGCVVPIGGENDQ
jgi:hypothetical protein